MDSLLIGCSIRQLFLYVPMDSIKIFGRNKNRHYLLYDFRKCKRHHEIHFRSEKKNLPRNGSVFFLRKAQSCRQQLVKWMEDCFNSLASAQIKEHTATWLFGAKKLDSLERKLSLCKRHSAHRPFSSSTLTYLVALKTDTKIPNTQLRKAQPIYFMNAYSIREAIF